MVREEPFYKQQTKTSYNILLAQGTWHSLSTNYLFPFRPVGGDPHERYGHLIENYKIQTTYTYVNNENKIR